MNIKIPIISIIGLIAVSCLQSKRSNPGSLQKQPNFIFIYSDDQRQDALGADGNRIIITPELDKLARQGVRFTNANVVFSLCSPSRAALLTGRYGSINGVLQLGSDLNPNEKTVAQYLHKAGYLTGLSGKWHIGRDPSEAGFDFSVWFYGNGTYYDRTIHDQGKTVNPKIHCDQYCVNRSIDFLKEAVKSGKPFFLFHNTQLPHMNNKLIWDALQETKDKYNVAEMPVAKSRLDNLKNKPEYLQHVRNRTQAKKYGYPDSLAIQKHTRDYYSVITEMDQFLGQLFKAIDELGIRENTYIFFMSDNGWMLGEHCFTSKVLPYKPSIHVPMFVVGPGIKPRTDENFVLNIDMAPTLLKLAGLNVPKNLQGKEITPLLFHKVTGFRHAFVYEGLGTYGGAKPNLTFVNNQYKFIVTYKSSSLDTVIFRELYDRKKDPDELFNMINDPAFVQVIPDLEKYISSYKHKNLENYISSYKHKISKDGKIN